MPLRATPPDRQPLMGATAEIRALERDLRHYPPLYDFILKSVNKPKISEDGGIDFPLATVHDLLGYRATVAMSLLLAEWTPFTIGEESFPVPRHDDFNELRLMVAHGVMMGVPILWPGEMFDAARELNLPDHVVSDDILPYPVMWWCLDRPRGENGHFESALVIEGESGINFQFIGRLDKDQRQPVSPFWRIEYGLHFKNDGSQSGLIDVILKLLAYMNSRYVDVDERQLDRPARRRIQRAEQPETFDPLPHTHIIRLRAAEPQVPASGQGGEGRWSHRWWVRGHYRAQWLPSKQAHRVTWIAPYIKGPADKPVFLPAVKVDR